MAKKKLRQGIFITFEGPEGSGKSTHAKLVYQFLKRKGYDCVFTREPGGTVIGNKIRDILLNPKYEFEIASSHRKGSGAPRNDAVIASEQSERSNPKKQYINPLAELLLFEASRAELIDKVIAPNLKKKKIVICDRFNDSTIVYQGYAGRLALGDVIRVDSYVTHKARPLLTIILDIDAKTGLKRARRNKKVDRMESKSLAFHKRVRNGFRDLAGKNKKRIRLVRVRGSIDDTQDEVRKIILEKIA